MKRPWCIVWLITTLLLCFSITAVTASCRSVATIGVKEYEEFHELLHPLEHDALPKKDFARIRENAAELVKRGEAIVKLGPPAGIAEKNLPEFRQQLTKFEDTLAQFGQHAKTGKDEQLAESFSAVHDSFEILWGLVPR